MSFSKVLLGGNPRFLLLNLSMDCLNIETGGDINTLVVNKTVQKHIAAQLARV
jgi:hypothetical protein